MLEVISGIVGTLMLTGVLSDTDYRTLQPLFTVLINWLIVLSMKCQKWWKGSIIISHAAIVCFVQPAVQNLQSVLCTIDYDKEKAWNPYSSGTLIHDLC